VNNQQELIKFFFHSCGKLNLIQKFIPNCAEYRVITINNRAELIARKGTVEEVNKKNLDDRKSVKGELPKGVLDMCEDVSKKLFSDIIGFDIMHDLDTDKYYIIETNASPHFSMFSVVTGVSIPEKIVDYIIKQIINHHPNNEFFFQESINF